MLVSEVLFLWNQHGSHGRASQRDGWPGLGSYAPNIAIKGILHIKHNTGIIGISM